jgi:hypothetical protein
MIDHDDVGLRAGGHGRARKITARAAAVQFAAIMTGQTAAGGGDVHVYETKQRVGVQATLFIAGGILFFLVLLAQFVLLLGVKESSRTQMMPGLIGGLSVFGIALIARGVFLLKTVVRVTLDATAVHLDGFIGRRTVPYPQIERVARDKQSLLLGGKTIDVLSLHAAGQKQPIAIIPDTIGNFEMLAAELAARTAAAQGGRVTYDPVADQQQRDTRDARRMKWTAFGFCLFTLLFVTIFGFGLREELRDRALARDGKTTDARITRHFMIRVTPYIAYTFFDDRAQPHSKEVMVTQELFDATEGRKSVPVAYLPSDPEHNRLAAGTAEKSFGGKFLFLSGGGTLMFGALAVMTLLGIDIKSENGRTRITRHGKTIREFGAQPPTPPALPPMPAFDETSPPPPLSAADEARVAAVVAAYNAQPPPPVPYAPNPPKRTGLIVLAVLCVLIGLLGLATMAARLYFTAGPRTIQLSGRAVFIDETPAWIRIWSAADGLLALLLITTGVGLLAMKRWSRPLGITVAVLQILSTIGAIVALLARSDFSGEGPESMNVVVAATGAVIFHLLTTIFPAVLIFVLAKRSTAEALT